MALVEAEQHERGEVKGLGKIDDTRTRAAHTAAPRRAAGRAVDTAGAS